MKYLTTAVFVCLFVIWQPLFAQESAETEKNDSPEPFSRVVVMRLNGKTLTTIVDRDVQLAVPIDETTPQAQVNGNATVSAHVALDFAGGTDSRIPIRITGQCDVCANAAVGPVVATIGAQIPFSLEIAVGFDGVRKFYPLPGCASANTCISIHCLDTKKRRIGRRVIRRVACNVAGRKLPEAQKSASRKFERELLKEADKQLKQFTKQINDALVIDKTISELMTEQNCQRQISKQNDYLELRLAPIGSAVRSPPESQIANVPIEVWIYPQIEQEELLDRMADILEEIPDDLLDMVPELPEGDLDLDPDELVKTSVVDDWTVFRVGDFETLKEMIKELSSPQSGIGSGAK